MSQISGLYCIVEQGSRLTDGPSDAGQFGKAAAAVSQPLQKRRGRSNEGRCRLFIASRHQNESVSGLVFQQFTSGRAGARATLSRYSSIMIVGLASLKLSW